MAAFSAIAWLAGVSLAAARNLSGWWIGTSRSSAGTFYVNFRMLDRGGSLSGSGTTSDGHTFMLTGSVNGDHVTIRNRYENGYTAATTYTSGSAGTLRGMFTDSNGVSGTDVLTPVGVAGTGVTLRGVAIHGHVITVGLSCALRAAGGPSVCRPSWSERVRGVKLASGRSAVSAGQSRTVNHVITPSGRRLLRSDASKSVRTVTVKVRLSDAGASAILTRRVKLPG